MRIAVLGSLESWYVKDLRRAAEGRHEVAPVTFRQLSSAIAPERCTATSGGYDLAAADCVLVRTMPPGSLEQVVFRMDVLGRLEAAGTRVVNCARAIEVAVDKYLATAKLQAAGLRVPRTITCQTTDEALAAFHALGGDAVIKPLFGSEGRGITRLTDEALAERAFKMLEGFGAVIYLQEFIAHDGFDLRLLVIGKRVFGIRRHHPTDWRTNVSRGAKAEPLEVTADLGEIALKAAAAVGAVLAGVDVLIGPQGESYTIEVNAVPGWQAAARTLNLDVAGKILDYLAD